MKLLDIQPKSKNFFYAGLLASLLLVPLTFSLFFEQLDWKVLAWIRYGHETWQNAYGVAMSILSVIAFVVLVGVLLPVVARMLLKSKQQLLSAGIFLATTAIGIALLEGLSELYLSGKGELLPVTQSVVTNWYSFVFVTGLFVLLPLLAVTTGIRAWQRHSDHSQLNKKNAEG